MGNAVRNGIFAVLAALAASQTAFAQSGAAKATVTAGASASSRAQAAQPAMPPAFDPRDLSGVWNRREPPPNTPFAQILVYVSTFGDGKPSMTAAAQAQFDAAKPSFGPRSVTLDQTNDPAYKCFPPGTPRIYLHPFPMQIVETPKEVIQIFEYDHTVRRIYTDGRPHPPDLNPTYMGHSIGHWEGDTLVADTVGFNEKTWLDRVGHPHSDQLHVVERFRRTGARNLAIDLAIEDPKDYTKPITSQLLFLLHPDWDILELACTDNINFVPYGENEQAPAK